MKNLISSVSNKMALIFAMLFLQVSAFAQIDVDIDLGKDEWYENPMIWVGVAVFLLVLVLLGRRKG